MTRTQAQDREGKSGNVREEISGWLFVVLFLRRSSKSISVRDFFGSTVRWFVITFSKVYLACLFFQISGMSNNTKAVHKTNVKETKEKK